MSSITLRVPKKTPPMPPLRIFLSPSGMIKSRIPRSPRDNATLRSPGGNWKFYKQKKFTKIFDKERHLAVLKTIMASASPRFSPTPLDQVWLHPAYTLILRYPRLLLPSHSFKNPMSYPPRTLLYLSHCDNLLHLHRIRDARNFFLFFVRNLGQLIRAIFRAIYMLLGEILKASDIYVKE